MRADGATSRGAPLEVMRANGERVKQVVVVTDEGDNTPPLFAAAYVRYAQDVGVSPDVVIVRVGAATNVVQQGLSRTGVASHVFTFAGRPARRRRRRWRRRSAP